jgi:broad specificity phosphatase PhoE
MKFIFIRHSKTDHNPHIPITRWGLTSEGIELANELSRQDIIENMNVMYASLQTKALETAVLLAKPNGIAMKTDDQLTEVTSFTNRYEEDFNVYTKSVHDFYSGDSIRIDNGETKDEALARFISALERIVKTESNQEYVGIVSHGNILTLFTALYKDVDSYELHTAIKQPDVAIFNWDEKKFETFFGEL